MKPIRLKFEYTFDLETYLQEVGFSHLEQFQRDFRMINRAENTKFQLRHWLNNCVIHESSISPAQVDQWLEALGTELRRREALR